ncbi:MAG TPA: hypothetical protein DIS78_04080 [Lachnospiraceae bacterium]|nr:hypothetical protein [Lachnospiraceae bacterium]
MESFSKFASRFEKNLNLNRSIQGRDNSDRLRAEREYERRRLEKNQVNIEQIKEVVTDSNSDQLDAIQDLFYDERVDREASGKELLRAVDNNQKLLNKNFRLLSDMKDGLDSDDGLDLRELSEANKEEILKAVFSNGDLLKQVLDNTDLLKTLKEELIDKKVEEEKEKEDNAFDKASAEKAFIDLEDHVHKENVKCYRNVQAAMEEMDEKSFGRLKKGMDTLKGLLIAAVVLGAANLIFIICQYLHLI